MKAKELIRQLQEADPSGELEVCVDNLDINFISTEPAYWDGKQQVIIRDQSNGRGRVIGAKIASKGSKVQIRTLSIHEAIWANPELPVDYSDLSPEQAEEFKKRHDEYRQASIDCTYHLELECFTEHVRERLSEITDDLEGVEEACEEFLGKYLDPKQPFPDDLPRIGESHISLRNKQWARQVKVLHDINGVRLEFTGDEKY